MTPHTTPRPRAIGPALLRAFLGVLVVSLLGAPPARAADLRLLGAGAVREAVLALAPAFERASGHRIVATFEAVGGLRRRLEAGESFDVAIVPRPLLDALAGRLAAGRDLGRVGIGVAVREGAPLPDVASPEALRRTLLAARSIVQGDPATTSSGRFVAAMLERLGIAGEVAGRVERVAGGYVVERVAEGRAEIGLHQISEILPVRGVVLVGPLPPALQSNTVYAVAATRAEPDPAAAALLAFLASPEARAVLREKGVEPIP